MTFSISNIFNRNRNPQPVFTMAVEHDNGRVIPFNLGDQVQIVHYETHGDGTVIRAGIVFGEIVSVGMSPYYEEELHGVQRAYVVGDGFATYVLPGDILASEHSVMQLAS